MDNTTTNVQGEIPEAELKENLAHQYADRLPDHEYMPARQGFERGWEAYKESLKPKPEGIIAEGLIDHGV